MNELQTVLFQMLNKLVEVFNKLDIKYFVTEGSCLGTVRHGGFIPWDDDIDVAIYAEDYERFVELAPDLLGERYRVIGAFEQKSNPNETDMITRVIDLDYDIELNVYKEKKDFHPWIDVSIICGLPNSKLLAKLYLWRIYGRKAFVKMSNTKYIGFNSTKKRSIPERILLYIIKRIDISSFFDEFKQSRKLKKQVMNYRVSNTRYVAAFPSDYRLRELMKKEVYGEGRLMNFMGLRVCAPELIDEYLSILYGNYMELPPLEQRVGRHNYLLNKRVSHERTE